MEPIVQLTPNGNFQILWRTSNGNRRIMAGQFDVAWPLEQRAIILTTMAESWAMRSLLMDLRQDISNMLGMLSEEDRQSGDQGVQLLETRARAIDELIERTA